MEEMTDGTSNTVAIVAAKDATPWTRPASSPLAPGQVRAVLDNSDGAADSWGP